MLEIIIGFLLSSSKITLRLFGKTYSSILSENFTVALKLVLNNKKNILNKKIIFKVIVIETFMLVMRVYYIKIEEYKKQC